MSMILFSNDNVVPQIIFQWCHHLRLKTWKTLNKFTKDIVIWCDTMICEYWGKTDNTDNMSMIRTMLTRNNPCSTQTLWMMIRWNKFYVLPATLDIWEVTMLLSHVSPDLPHRGALGHHSMILQFLSILHKYLFVYFLDLMGLWGGCYLQHYLVMYGTSDDIQRFWHFMMHDLPWRRLEKSIFAFIDYHLLYT